MSKNIENVVIQCKPVKGTAEVSWTVQIKERGGTIWALWNSSSEVECDWATLHLYLDENVVDGEKVVREHKTGKRSGEIDLGLPYGSGYRLALMAKDAESKWIEVVSTAKTNRLEPPPPPAEKTYSFSIELTNLGGKTKLTWQSSASFTMRESKYHLYVEGNQKHLGYMRRPSGFIDFNDVRWGVGLAAVWTAEGYDGKEHVLVRTPETGD